MNIQFDSIEKPALTKADLAELIYGQIGLNKREAKDMVDSLFDEIAQQIIAGEDVKISGSGNFETRQKAARPGRNPRTGEAVQIKPRRVVTFYVSPKLRSAIQGDED